MHAAVILALLASLSFVPQRSAAQLSKAAWDALNAGRLQEAAATFDEALRTGPQQPSILLGAGVAARLQGRNDDARRLLVDALRIDPSLTAASLLLGSLLYQSGDLDGAIGVYQRAQALGSTHPELARQLDAWRKEASLHDGFRRTLGDHFTVLFEGPAQADLADRAVTILEAAYWRIGTALNAYPTDVVTVILYTREQFRDITRSPEWAGGSFDGRIRVPVQGVLQNGAEFERVLAHEFTHALIQSLAPRNVPTWLDEGLADCFDGGDIRRKEEQVRRAETRLPLKRLERSFAGLSTSEATLAYAQSATAVRLLLDQAGAPALVNLLMDLGRGSRFDDAFERNILMPYAEFEKKLQG